MGISKIGTDGISSSPSIASPTLSGTVTMTGLAANTVPVISSSNTVVGIAPGTSGNVLTSNGTSWSSGVGVADGSITTAKLADASVTAAKVASGVLTSAATQAEMEAGSSTSVYASPGRQQYHPSASKAWLKGTSDANSPLEASYNVSSVTIIGVGHYRATWAVPFSSVGYAVVGTAQKTSGSALILTIDHSTPPTTTYVDVYTRNDVNTVTDVNRWYLAAFGDQ